QYLNGNVYSKGETGPQGTVVFAALSDIISASGDTYSGNYMVNASVFNEQTWYAPELAVSLAHYSVPLTQENANVSVQVVIRLPELVITTQGITVLSSPVVEGSNVTVSALVFNLGYAPVTENFTVEFFLPGEAAVNVTTALTGPLGVGQAVPVNTVWSVPMSYGNMSISVYLNPGKELPEASYSDNFATINVTVLELPELIPIAMNMTGSFQEFSNVTFTVAIRNAGQIDAGLYVVTILEGNAPNNVTLPIANGTVDGTDAGSTAIAHIVWTIPPLPSGVRSERVYFTAAVDMNHSVKQAAYSHSMLLEPVQANITQAQVNADITVSSTSVKSGSVVIVTVTVVSRATNKGMADFPVTVTLYNIRGVQQSGATYEGTTGSNGLMIARISIPANEPSGAYHFNVYSSGEYISSSQSFNVVRQGPSSGFPLLYLLIIIAGVVAAFGGFSFYLYRYGLARVVECGNCGAFIPETAKKCPYCGVEFESGTAKCSNCSSWIPATSKQCPICGVKFADEGEAEQEDEYTAGMRKKYAEYVEKFKSQAKAELGKKYSERGFLDWWKKQPTYVTFEDWLSRQQAVNKAKLIACPSCGEPNPASAQECVKCGTPLVEKEKPAQPPQNPPPANKEQKPQEPRKIVVPRKIIRKVEEKPKSSDQSEKQNGEQPPQ
ncbi:MAG: CARDB domain-containing protein, partial [Methanomassiliicoccales archaeon]